MAIIIDNNHLINEKKCDEILDNLNITKNKIDQLITKFITPTLNCFKDWQNLLTNKYNINFESVIPDIFFDYLKDITNYEDSELHNQILNKKKILLKFKEKIEENISFINYYKVKYAINLDCYLFVAINDIEDLYLTEAEKTEIEFLENIGLNEFYDLSEKKNILFGISILGFKPYTYITNLFSSVGYHTKNFYRNVRLMIKNNGNIDIQPDGLIYNIIGMILRYFFNKDEEKNIIYENNNLNPEQYENIKIEKKNVKEKIVEELKK